MMMSSSSFRIYYVFVYSTGRTHKVFNKNARYDSCTKGSFINYVMLSRWMGGQQNITTSKFNKVDDLKMLAKT